MKRIFSVAVSIAEIGYDDVILEFPLTEYLGTFEITADNGLKELKEFAKQLSHKTGNFNDAIENITGEYLRAMIKREKKRENNS